MRIVAALGGNALLRRGEPLEAETQRRNVSAAVARARAGRARARARRHPRERPAGRPARAPGGCRPSVQPYPLDVLGAETEGMIGYLLEQELRNALPGRSVATLLTQVVVDRRGSGVRRPTKPIGPVYTEHEARRLAAARGWSIAPDGRAGVESCPRPEPVGIVELAGDPPARRRRRARRVRRRRWDPGRRWTTRALAGSRR